MKLPSKDRLLEVGHHVPDDKRERSRHPRRTWEYLVEGAMAKGLVSSMEKTLDHRGAEGWELVGIDPDKGRYVFKREAF